MLNASQISHMQSIISSKVNRGVALVKLREKVSRIIDESNKLQEYSVDIAEEKVSSWLTDLNSAIAAMQSEATSVASIEDVATTVTEISEFIPTETVSITQIVTEVVTEAVTETVEAVTETQTDVDGNEVEIVVTPATENVITPAVTEDKTVVDTTATGRILGQDTGSNTKGTTLTANIITALFDEGVTEILVQIIETDSSLAGETEAPEV
jgi:hypothetical protein